MNINDVTEEIMVPENIWQSIFNKQMELAKKYSDIESMGDLLQTTANNIDTGKGQKWIKDFAWRVTEELAEAFEAKYEGSGKKIIDMVEDVSEYEEHFKEELADSLHFLVELTIIAGYHHGFVLKALKEHKTEYEEAWLVVYYLGLMCNTLKNKPWKQSQMLTDRPKFEKYLMSTWRVFLDLLHNTIGDDIQIYEYYFKKNKVNQFRQRSKY